MTWVDEAIRDFGRGIGFADLALSGNGVVSLSFEARGTLFIERAEGDAVLVYLSRAVPYPPPGLFERALAACHYKEGLPFPVSAGFLGDDRLVFLVRLPEKEFSLPALERAIELLTQLHDRMAS